MCSAARALREGFGWQFGDGKSISLHKERWGFEGLDGSSLLQPSFANTTGVVCDLWTRHDCKWDKARVTAPYGGELARRICEIPLLKNAPRIE